MGALFSPSRLEGIRGLAFELGGSIGFSVQRFEGLGLQEQRRSANIGRVGH